MKNLLTFGAFAAGCLALSGPARARLAQDSKEKPAGETQVIEVTARKYEFAPAEIHVPKGSRVRLKVHSTDEAHGIKLNVCPEGTQDKSSPGLVFDNPQENGKVEKGQDQVLDFLAQQAGTYEFKCAKVCGMHHGRMKGKLIVEQ
jgi:heme/copper-type cytochrome/quinol oxidase subunit 2